MTTQPPPGPPAYQRPYYGQGMPELSIPNPEFVVYVVVLVVIGLVAAISDSVTVNAFITSATAVTVGYFVSRGLTKFGKGTEPS